MLAAQRLRTDILYVAGCPVEAGCLTAIDDFRVQRIRRDVPVFFNADRVPVAKADGTVVAAAGNADRSALLLPAINPVRKSIVCDDVIKLCGRLVVPGTPGAAAVDAEGGALVNA